MQISHVSTKIKFFPEKPNPGPRPSLARPPVEEGPLRDHDARRQAPREHTTLFAPLSMLDGTVIGGCITGHRHQEFIRFLKKIDTDTLAGLDVHWIVDNYGTHKHPRVKRWLQRHLHSFRRRVRGCTWLSDDSESSPTSASVAAVSRVSRN